MHKKMIASCKHIEENTYEIKKISFIKPLGYDQYFSADEIDIQEIAKNKYIVFENNNISYKVKNTEQEQEQ